MSTSGRTCRDIKAHVATLKSGKEHKIMLRLGILCCDKKLKSKIGRILRQISLCCDIMKNIRQNLCHDKIFSYRDTDYCNLESLLRHCMKKFCRDKVMNVVNRKNTATDQFMLRHNEKYKA